MHESTCEESNLLSRGYDRGLDKRPILVYGVTAVIVAHLLNWLPRKADPISWIHIISNHITKGT